jgi:hypothetical protein
VPRRREDFDFSDELVVIPVDERGDRVRFRWQRPPHDDSPVLFI